MTCFDAITIAKSISPSKDECSKKSICVSRCSLKLNLLFFNHGNTGQSPQVRKANLRPTTSRRTAWRDLFAVQKAVFGRALADQRLTDHFLMAAAVRVANRSTTPCRCIGILLCKNGVVLKSLIIT